MNLRCFIAIGVNDPIKKQIGEFINGLKKYDVDIKWIAPENIHFTLKFLGNTSDVLLPHIQEHLLKIMSSYDPFYIKIYGTGAFPNGKNPRVIWIGIEETETLIKMKNDIEDSMALLGYQKEDKAFHPHLTIGRVRSRRGILQIIDELHHYKKKYFGTLYINTIELMKSDLNPKGAVYTCLQRIPLRKMKAF